MLFMLEPAVKIRRKPGGGIMVRSCNVFSRQSADAAPTLVYDNMYSYVTNKCSSQNKAVKIPVTDIVIKHSSQADKHFYPS